MIKYIVFGREGCVWCEKAAALLKNSGLNYKYYDINTMKGRLILDSFSDIIPKTYKYVPKIVKIDGEFIEGYDGIKKILSKKSKNNIYLRSKTKSKRKKK